MSDTQESNETLEKWSTLFDEEVDEDFLETLEQVERIEELLRKQERYEELIDKADMDECLHEKLEEQSSGTKSPHMLSCPCPKCTPRV